MSYLTTCETLSQCINDGYKTMIKRIVFMLDSFEKIDLQCFQGFLISDFSPVFGLL